MQRKISMEAGTETSDTEIAKEIVRCGGLDRVYMALDYFDAGINRVSAWAMGYSPNRYSSMPLAIPTAILY